MNVSSVFRAPSSDSVFVLAWRLDPVFPSSLFLLVYRWVGYGSRKRFGLVWLLVSSLAFGSFCVLLMKFVNIGLPSPATWRAYDLDWFHSYLNSLLFGILLFVFLLLVRLFLSEGFFSVPGLAYRRSEFLAAWVPCLILITLMVPSLFNLYSMRAFDTSADLTIKIVAHQWYWVCQYADISNFELDIYGKSLGDLGYGEPRLLETTQRIVLPCGVNVRICVTSADVIHSLSFPRLGIKMDAVPGILNVGVYNFPVIGVFYGQCSEICGANHTFIPICMEVTTWECFLFWLSLNSC